MRILPPDRDGAVRAELEDAVGIDVAKEQAAVRNPDRTLERLEPRRVRAPRAPSVRAPQELPLRLELVSLAR